jgi:hypothetical protein
MPEGFATTNPEGKLSVTATPLNAVVEFGLVMVSVKLVIPPTGMLVAPNALLPIQARFWLERGSSMAGQSVAAARSRFRAVHSDSISTRPSQPVA